MITREEDIDAHALHRRGWTISAIARHLGRDRKARLAEDPHLWATALFDEVTGLGYDRSYPKFTRQLRARDLRPHCGPCHPLRDRAVAVIEHPPGGETQWDWVELPGPPASWGWGSRAFLLVGVLAHSGGGAAGCPPRRTSRT